MSLLRVFSVLIAAASSTSLVVCEVIHAKIPRILYYGGGKGVDILVQGGHTG